MISFSKIKQRKMKMESSTTSVYRPNINNITSPITLNIMETFLNSINNSEDINYFGTKIFDIYESFVHDNSNHPNYVEKITDMIEENVIPRYNDLQSLKTYINTSDTLKVFGESVDDFIYCDRILKNDRTINKRFDMKSFIESNSNMDLDEMVRSLCEFIDTYDISTEAKYNIALENITFMLLSKDKTLDESVIQNHITDYFLMRESVMTDTYIRKLQKVAINSPLVNESTLNAYLFSKGHVYGDRIQSVLEYDLSTLTSERKVSEQIYTWLDEMCIDTPERNKRIMDNIIALPLAVNVSESFINGTLINYMNIHENSLFNQDIIKESLNQYKNGLNGINFLNENKNDEKLELLMNLNDELNIYEYGIPIHGQIADIQSYEFCNDNYKSLSINEFEKNKGGLCWDYTKYYDFKLNEFGIEHKNFFIINQNTLQTHSITIVELNGKIYYVESSYKRMCGIYEAKNINDALAFAIYNLHIGSYEIYEIIKFPKDHTNNEKYIEYICKENKKYNKPLKLNNKLKNIQSAPKFPKDTRITNESKNDKGEKVPKKCPKCGGDIGLFFKGEPVYLCKNCNKYFGVAPFKENAYVSEMISTLQDPATSKIKEYNGLLETKLEKTDLNKAFDQFKAEQRKDSKAFQKVLNALYAKTPNEIINEFPHVLGLVRVAFVFAPIAVPIVGPVLTLVNACVDKILSYHINVKQSEKLFKYLRDEKTKVEEKLDDIDDEEKKKKAESYIKELEDSMKTVKKYASEELPKEIEDNDGNDDDFDDISFDDFDFDMELESYQITESAYENDDISLLADISLYEQSLEHILNNRERVNSMILRNIDTISENLRYFAPIIANCPTVIDYRVFSEAVKDYMYDPTSMDSVNVNGVLNKALENKFMSDTFKNTIIESECINTLDQIVTEGFNLNNVKIAFQALKKKMKDLNTKQKSICQTLDATGHQLISSIEKAVREDRREAVIKGSIIPSFSKCIKLGIALGGITAVNPVAGLITAVGYFGASSMLTQREKQLVYDEIATELQVVEKQLQIAENDGDMNQYRFLLNYQKKLARERQRIRYGLKVNGRRIPDARGPKRD